MFSFFNQKKKKPTEKNDAADVFIYLFTLYVKTMIELKDPLDLLNHTMMLLHCTSLNKITYALRAQYPDLFSQALNMRHPERIKQTMLTTLSQRKIRPWVSFMLSCVPHNKQTRDALMWVFVVLFLSFLICIYPEMWKHWSSQSDRIRIETRYAQRNLDRGLYHEVDSRLVTRMLMDRQQNEDFLFILIQLGALQALAIIFCFYFVKKAKELDEHWGSSDARGINKLREKIQNYINSITESGFQDKVFSQWMMHYIKARKVNAIIESDARFLDHLENRGGVDDRRYNESIRWGLHGF